jgi:hypothetical protein
MSLRDLARDAQRVIEQVMSDQMDREHAVTDQLPGMRAEHIAPGCVVFTAAEPGPKQAQMEP